MSLTSAICFFFLLFLTEVTASFDEFGLSHLQGGSRATASVLPCSREGHWMTSSTIPKGARFWDAAADISHQTQVAFKAHPLSHAVH